jgi:GrpB-like predicted nucleotidyltransferase (UPF0157 family)
LRFSALGEILRQALGDIALRIDHIGSTAVPGLDAKPIIDIQISVASFELLAAFRLPLERAGFVYRADNPDKSKRYFREAPGTPRTHIHVRRAGSWSEQFALLFRDYLRTHPDEARQYAELKYRLAACYLDDRTRYVEEKTPCIWAIMRKANDWMQLVGWIPGPTDA